MNTRYIINHLLVLSLPGMCFFPLHAQERFDEWISGDQFLISRMVSTKEKSFLITLPGGQAKEWTKERNMQSQFQSSLSLGDGRIISVRDNDLIIQKADGTIEQLTSDQAEEKNPRLSADKSRIAYTKDNDLYVFDLNNREEKRLTHDGSESIYNGWASWVYYEEILGRSSRFAAFWWSPDSKKIAFLHFDDHPVPTFPLFRSEGQHGNLEIARYPKAGDSNPLVQFAVADVNTGKIVWIEEDRNKDQYSALPFWTPDSKYLLIQEMNRGQDTLHIARTDPTDGRRKVIYEETHRTWVEFFEEMHFIGNDDFIILSDREGWHNLYRYDLDGNLIANLTPVSWRVTDVERIDLQKNHIYFYGTGPVNTDRHFFRAGLSGSDLQQITTLPGWHQVKPSTDFTYFLDEYSSLENPLMSQVIDQEGKVIYRLEAEVENPNRRSGVTVEPLTIDTEDGFKLPGYWVLPKGFDKQKKYPVVFTVYGGPDAGNVRNSFQNYSGDFYANHDIIRIAMDHRGSGKFGKKGMDFMHRNLGKWEVDDLIATVKWLRTISFIDSTRIGITGGSYGGYVTCMAMTYGSEYFTHGISLFPVTDWHLYDNVYTERYMDTPTENPDGYKFGSAIEQAYKLKGKFLIVHGVMDDNVHMQNTLQFISRLQDLGKDFDMMIYPGERHGWGGPKKTHLNTLVNNFWKDHLISTGTKWPMEP